MLRILDYKLVIYNLQRKKVVNAFKIIEKLDENESIINIF